MSEAALPRILCVDDEPNLLAGLERSLFDRFDVTTADGGAAGLAALEASGPFAAIVSDMRMPNMDGVAFLAQARQRAPDTVRILLTGQADTASAIAAINHGAIFRFLCKPCPTEVLVATLDEATTRHRMTLLEREVLETTLSSAVNTLGEVLSMAAPAAFQCATLAQTCVRHALGRLDWAEGWTVQVAAALSQIGLVGVPSELLQRDLAGEPLEDSERALLQRHPEVGYRLIVSIPRLQPVAEIVRHQAVPPPPEAADVVVRGAHLLRAALELTRLLAGSASHARALGALTTMEPPVPGEIVRALFDFRMESMRRSRSVRVRDLMPGWIVEEDIRTQRGILVLTAGSELTATAILALRNHVAAHAIAEPLRVSCSG
ncbi:response regulator [Luteimonas sp. SJ-16]|uniref:Response regulator n=2 Tax=Luteimonas deserti TaxID=2752306 RepID=A0A7Z0QQX4_9GAMM|nr:response regulator [Luteimonas deserti]